MRDVVAHGLGAYKQTCGDLGVTMALGNEIEDLHLEGGELGESLRRRGRCGLGEEAHEAPGDLRTEVGSPPRHGAQHLQDLGRGRTLEDVTAGTCTHGREHRVVVLEHSEDHHTYVRVGLHDTAGCLYAVNLRHLYVHEDYVRPELGGPLDYHFSGGRLAHDLHTGLRAKHGAQSFPNDAVVVCYEDADGVLHDDEGAPSACSFGASSGRRARTRVPPCGSGSTAKVPPSSSARSRIEESPTPATRSTGIPTPSSMTSNLSAPGASSTDSRT